MTTRPAIFITGTSSGIGYHLATQALEAGYRVVGAGRKSPVFSMDHAAYEHIFADLSDCMGLKGVLERAFEADLPDRYDAVFLNAGQFGPPPAKAHTIDLAAFIEVQMVNFVANKVLLDFFVPTGRTKTVFISSSMAGVRPRQGMVTYVCSKSALNALIKTYALENPDVFFGLLALCNVDTDMFRTLLQADDTMTEIKALKERLKTPDYITTPQVRAGHLLDLLKGAHRSSLSSGDFVDIRSLFGR